MARPNPAPRFVLTGPTGWIGLAMLTYLTTRLRIAPDLITAFGSRPGEVILTDGTAIPVRELESMTPADVAGAHVIHLAYLTRDKLVDVGERRFSDTNIAIDDRVLGAMSEGLPASVFVASSGAAALALAGQDLHPYGLGKLRQEARFLEWAASHRRPVLAGRIFNIAGPWINKHNAYAIADFAVQALRGSTIAIAARRPVFRSFLHVNDLCALVVGAALAGVGRDRAIDLCGAQVVEMQEVAEAVVLAAGTGVGISRPDLDLGQPSSYLGNHVDTRVLAMELNVDLASFSRQAEDTVAWIARTVSKVANPDSSLPGPDALTPA